jgi:ABC-type ATPase involved in cell division
MGINYTVDKRPTDLIVTDQRAAIAVRELARTPELLILERPVEFVGLSLIKCFTAIVKEMVANGMTVVFYSDDSEFLLDVVCGEIHITNGELSIKRC